MLDRTAARARCEAATEGPWVVEGGGGMHMDGTRDWYSIGCQWNEVDKYRITSMVRKPNADFIAHAREDLPAALDALDAKDAKIERLRKALISECEKCAWVEHWTVCHRYGCDVKAALEGRD